MTVPELGTIRAAHPPVVVLTSNRTRDLHDALTRRCLYHWIDYPVAGAGRRDRPPPGARQCRAAGASAAAAAVGRLRVAGHGQAAGHRRGDRLGGGAGVLGLDRLDAVAVEATWGSVLKNRDDQELARTPRCRLAGRCLSGLGRPMVAPGPLAVGADDGAAPGRAAGTARSARPGWRGRSRWCRRSTAPALYWTCRVAWSPTAPSCRCSTPCSPRSSTACWTRPTAAATRTPRPRSGPSRAPGRLPPDRPARAAGGPAPPGRASPRRRRRRRGERRARGAAGRRLDRGAAAAHLVRRADRRRAGRRPRSWCGAWCSARPSGAAGGCGPAADAATRLDLRRTVPRRAAHRRRPGPAGRTTARRTAPAAAGAALRRLRLDGALHPGLPHPPAGRGRRRAGRGLRLLDAADPAHPAAGRPRPRPRARAGGGDVVGLGRWHPARRGHRPVRLGARPPRDGPRAPSSSCCPTAGRPTSPEDVAEAMRRLRRLAHRIVWVNPRKAAPGYEPLVAGMGRRCRTATPSSVVTASPHSNRWWRRSRRSHARPG